MNTMNLSVSLIHICIITIFYKLICKIFPNLHDSTSVRISTPSTGPSSSLLFRLNASNLRSVIDILAP